MDGIPSGPQEEEYPIIEPGVTIEWLQGFGSGTPPDLVKVVGMYADEDGTVQLRIEETAPDSPDSPRSITLDDLYEQLEWREYEVRDD